MANSKNAGAAETPKKTASRSSSPDSTSAGSSSPETVDDEQHSDVKVMPQEKCDPNLWYIHGNSYDLSGYVAKHPGGELAILSGRGRDCTALFESYHPFNDKHRKVLAAYGEKPPPPDPFYEEIKEKVRKAYPGGYKEVKMPWTSFAWLYSGWALSIYLFFVHKTALSCAAAGFLMATIGTRLAHEGGHFQMSNKAWVNRMGLFLGYFLTGPSMIWHYRHVISHHAHTNQEEDVDVCYVWIADKLPAWMKHFLLPGLPIGAMLEIGLKGTFDMVVLRDFGGNRVDWRLGGMWLEVPVWLFVHYYFGPSLFCYACMYFVAGAIFVPCSQVAHVILFPDAGKHKSWARLQIAESADFATDSTFWFHMAFGLTTQVEHHLFPGIGHHLYDDIRLMTREVCKKHKVTHMDISASKAFSALWSRWVTGQPVPLA